MTVRGNDGPRAGPSAGSAPSGAHDGDGPGAGGSTTVTVAAGSLVTRATVRLRADPARVITTLFVPGEEMPEDHSRADAVVERVQCLDDAVVAETLADVTSRFAGRHRRLEDTFLRHFETIAEQLGAGITTSLERRLLIGAYFTREDSPEGISLTNPSMVEHPDQTGLAPDEVRFVMSARAVGEGHLSCIEFRTGTVGPGRTVRVDEPGELLVKSRPRSPVYEASTFHAQLAQLGSDNETAHAILDRLGDTFDRAALDLAIFGLGRRALSRRTAAETVAHLALVADNNYETVFPEDTVISERVMFPSSPAEGAGMEDARFVRLVEDDGAVTYCATYTAYDGSRVAPQLLQTLDFRTFEAHQLSGPSARNKGMALFPRRIDGRYVALSRWDRENISVAFSDDNRAWGEPTTIQFPRQPWELNQLGNCGSPIETDQGWLVLTHGVGPMRTYVIGALLLDLDDPATVRGTLQAPLLAPEGDERDGYVPNVVYSCGALRHGETLVVPYGYGDQAIGIAFVDLPELIERALDPCR